jgi:hypothetical protein
MTTFFNDTFTEAASTSLAAHVPDTGTGWTLLWDSGGGARVLQVDASVDQLRCNGNSGDYGLMYTANATYPTANYEVQATFLGTFSTITPIYLLARVQDQENMYALRLVSGTSGVQLYKKVAGAWSTLGSAVTIANGSVVKLSVNGSAIKVFDDGVEVISVTDSSISAAGKAGVAHGGAAELVTSTDDTRAHAMLDNFSVTDLGSGGGSHSLTATGVATGSPTVGSPAITQLHALTGNGVATGSPTVGTPALTQVHALTATGVATGNPTVGSPTLTEQVNYDLTATGVTTGTPTVGSPALTQTHSLSATGIATGNPTTGTPSLSQTHSLIASSIATGAPSVGSPAIVQVHGLVATGVTTGVPTVGSPLLWFGEPPPPVYVIVVEAETRRVVIEAEERVVQVKAERRTVVVPAPAEGA